MMPAWLRITRKSRRNWQYVVATFLALQFISILFTTAYSQPCTPENVTSQPGVWKQGMKGSSDHSSTDMAKEKIIQEKIAQIYRSNLKWPPTGGDITYNSIYSVKGLDYRPNPVAEKCNTYSAYIFFTHFFCANGKIGREDYSTIHTTSINAFPFRFESTFFIPRKDSLGNNLDEDPGTDTYGEVKKLPIMKDGLIEFIEDEYDGTGKYGGMVYRYLVVTKPGQMPFMAMGKKEYYEKWIKHHKQSINELERIKPRMEKLDKLHGGSANMESLEKQIQYYEGRIGMINAILKEKSPAELTKPAFRGEEDGNYFDPDTKGNQHMYIIKPHLDYFNGKLPKYAPQLITICFRYRFKLEKNGEKVYADQVFYNELEKIRINELMADSLKSLIVQ
jgi:hypothetical protein